MISIKRRVKAGAKFLDAKYGRAWRKKVRLRKLDMSEPRECILGQTDSDYGEHCEKLGITRSKAQKLGFEAGRGLWDYDIAYRRLTAAWKEYLRGSK